MNSQNTAARLRARRDEVVRRWAESVRSSIPGDKIPEGPLLIDHIPSFLDKLADTLAGAERKPEIRLVGTLGQQHAQQRAWGPMDLEELLLEYSLLRRSIVETLEEEHSLTPQERETIAQAMELAMRNAVTEFLLAKESQRYLKAKSHRPVFWKRLVVTLFLVVLGTGLKLLFWPYIDSAPYLFYYPVVILAALYGNGLSATLLSALAANYFFDAPQYSFDFSWPNDFISFALFLIGGGLVSWITSSLRIAQRRSEVAAGEQALARLEAENASKNLRSERALREHFIATLSHDLRNPLSAIKTGAQTLLRFPDRVDAVEKLASRIQSSADRADRMIGDLLDASRIKAGERLHLQYTYCDLNSLVDEAISELSIIHGNRFIVKSQGQISGYWSCDGLFRVVQNLASNGIKYGRKNTPVTISLGETDSDEVVISVHNFGSYIPPAERSGLFEPFQRTRSAQESGKSGWGIGLTLVRGISEAHHGHVQVDSSKDDGTTFTVTLPRDARFPRDASSPSPS